MKSDLGSTPSAVRSTPPVKTRATFRIELVGAEQEIMREIADPKMKRKDIALTYAFLLRQPGRPDWSRINHAIMARWSLAGLKWIKEEAWKLART